MMIKSLMGVDDDDKLRAVTKNLPNNKTPLHPFLFDSTAAPAAAAPAGTAAREARGPGRAPQGRGAVGGSVVAEAHPVPIVSSDDRQTKGAPGVGADALDGRIDQIRA